MRCLPNDPDSGKRWHLKNTGQTGNLGYAGTPGADIAAEAAWDITRGAGIRVAIVDSGFDVHHPDFAAAIGGTSGFFREDSSEGAAFVQGISTFPAPADSHGTFCAGLAHSVANQADLIAIACFRDHEGTQATMARAIAYAADPTQEVAGANPADGADVISCSLGPNQRNGYWLMTSTLRDAIDFAVNKGRGGRGTPVFWAVNDYPVAIAADEVLSYPATIAVGKSNRLDQLDPSAFGPGLDFLAPGSDIHSTFKGAAYAESSGTSFAAPIAAGVAALVLAVCPRLSWQDVRKILRDTCDKIGGPGVVYDSTGHNDHYGFGRVNAGRAVRRALAIL
jgi:thermitase